MNLPPKSIRNACVRLDEKTGRNFADALHMAGGPKVQKVLEAAVATFIEGVAGNHDFETQWFHSANSERNASTTGTETEKVQLKAGSVDDKFANLPDDVREVFEKLLKIRKLEDQRFWDRVLFAIKTYENETQPHTAERSQQSMSPHGKQKKTKHNERRPPQEAVG